MINFSFQVVRKTFGIIIVCLHRCICNNIIACNHLLSTVYVNITESHSYTWDSESQFYVSLSFIFIYTRMIYKFWFIMSTYIGSNHILIDIYNKPMTHIRSL